ncbi:MAG: maleylacetoacetate isomerase [Polyangiales bacterium]
MTLRLHNYWRSSASWRVRIALNLKGIAYEYVPVSLIADGGQQHTDAYRALNPMAQVPTLEIEEEGAVLRLTQSIAIVEYLEERFPTPSLLPKDAYSRARARALAELVNSGIQPLQNLEPQRYVREELHGDAKAWTTYFIGRGMRALEALASETAGRFLVGDEVSVADVCLIPQMFAARRFGVDPATLPTLARVEAACNALEAFAAARPERQPDAQPG